MSVRRPTDLELAAALRAHLPAPRADLRGMIVAAVDETRQQRAWPSLLGMLTDADPIARRRGLLLAAAALLAVALAGAAAAGALQLWRSQQLPAGAIGLFAFVRDGDLYVARPDGTEAVLVAHVDGSALSQPHWSADGRWLAVQTPEPAILGLDLTTGDLRRLAAGTIAAWSPVASTLAYFTPADQIALLDVERGDSRVLVEPLPGSEGYPGYENTLRWSPDGRQIAFTADTAEGEPRQLARVDASSGAMTAVANSATFGSFRPSWAPDASRIAYSLWFERRVPEGFWIVATEGASSDETRDPDGSALDPVWSPDGAWIAYRVLHWDGDVRSDRLMVIRPDGSDRRRLADDLGDFVRWSDEGAAIAYTVATAVDETERRELHEVRVADASDRIVPVPGDSRDFAWAAPVTDPTGAIGPPSLPSPAATVTPDEPIGLPAADDPVRPDSTWGGLGSGGGGEFGCDVSTLRFPDEVTVIRPEGPQPAEAPEPTAPAAGPSAAPQPAAEYCEIRFAPDGSAFVRTSQARDGFEVVRSDGTILTGLVPGDQDPVWSPAGGWIVSGCDLDGGCSIMHRDGTGHEALPGTPSWSPHEQVMAVTAADGTLLVGRGDGTGLRSIGMYPLPASWSPDGSTFAFVRDGDAWLALADGSQIRNLSRFPLGGATGAWWSPDGRWIAVLQGTAMWAFSPDGSIRRRLGSGLGSSGVSWGASWAPAWSPDGTWLAIEHDDLTRPIESQAQEVTLFHVGDWRAVRLTNAFQPVWSLDGRHLAVASDDGNGRDVADVMNADGTGRTTVWTDSDAVTPRLSPPVIWVP